MSRPSTGISKKPEPAGDSPRRLIVSFHDLHPGSRGLCERLLQRLAGLGVTRISLLVVPCWHGGPPFTANTEFTAWLRDLAAAGHDICLHGYTHRATSVTGGPVSRLIGRRYTQSEGEFFQITRDEATRRLALGLAMVGGDARLPVYGFTPPAWLLSAEGRAALVEAGLHYTTTWGRVELLRSHTIVPAPTLVYSCRNAWRRLVSRAWVRVWHRLQRAAPVLRVAVHPGDFADARLEASIFWHVAAALNDGRVAATYRDLIPGDASPVQPPAIAAA